MQDLTGDETTVRDILRVLFSHKLVFLIVTPIVIISAYVALEMRTPVFSASVTMLLAGQKEVEADSYARIMPKNLLISNTTMVKSKVVLERVVKKLNLDKRPLDYEKQHASKIKGRLIDQRVKKLKFFLEEVPAGEKRQYAYFQNAVNELASNVNVIPYPDTDLFAIRVNDYNPYEAVKIANSVSRSFIINDLEQQIVENKMKYGDKYATVVQLRNYIEEFEQYLDGRNLPDLDAMGPGTMKVVSQATPSYSPTSSVNKTSSLILAFILSMVLSAGLSFGFEYMDHTIKSPKEVVKYLNLACLGSIPKNTSKKLIHLEDNNSQYYQSYQSLYTRLYEAAKDQHLQSFLIADIDGPNESAAITANLAFYISQKMERNVLVIDADIRNCTISKLLDIPQTTGLADVLEEKIQFEDAIHSLGPQLSFLPAGHTDSNPMFPFGLSTMAKVLNKANE